jgi:hypothetical protein
VLVKAVAAQQLRGGVEGLAVIFLFRHYLELALKGIIVSGRWITADGSNADPETVESVKNIHDLKTLWQWVLKDAKPKMESGHWDNYDTEFVENCIAEFGEADKKGFAFRYSGQGSEFYVFDFDWLSLCMEHIRQVLGGIDTYLVERHSQNWEWENYLQSEAGF